MLLSLSPNNSGRKMFSTPLITQKPIVSNKYQHIMATLTATAFSIPIQISFLKKHKLENKLPLPSKGFQSRNSYFHLAVYLENIKTVKPYLILH